MLQLEALTCGYGQMQAVSDLSLSIPAKGIMALLGANGAGKSSTLMCIAGHVAVHQGEIRYRQEPITRLPAKERVKKGIAIVPEGRRLFAGLSVKENLIVGGYSRPKMRTPENMDRVLSLFPRLKERLDQLAGSLSGGEQQMLAIGRALMAEPELLMVDELSLGLMPKAIDLCYAALLDLNRSGLTIIMVEQSTQRALDVAHMVCVIESGRTVWQGSADQARGDGNMIDAFLGLH